MLYFYENLSPLFDKTPEERFAFLSFEAIGLTELTNLKQKASGKNLITFSVTIYFKETA